MAKQEKMLCLSCHRWSKPKNLKSPPWQICGCCRGSDIYSKDELSEETLQRFGGDRTDEK